jgi:parvulin-like peptidyl-prolyl isomerase
VQTRYPLPPQYPAPQPQVSSPGQLSPGQAPPVREPLPQQATYSANSGQPSFAQAPTAPAEAPAQAPGQVAANAQDQIFEPNRIVATVGSEFILYGDVAGAVEQTLAPILPQVKTDQDREDLAKIRQQLTRQMLLQLINTKLAYLEFVRTLEKNAPRDKLPEINKNIESQMGKKFEEELTAMRTKIAAAQPSEIQKFSQRDFIMPRLALLMRDNHAETLQELDALLRQYGSSLAKQIRLYGEDRLGKETIRREVFTSEEITHQEMLDYYTTNAADFAVQAKARFEILSVKFASFAPTQEGRNQAWNKLAKMGNEVYFGAPFSTTARRHSEEPNAAKGGYYDWTTQGSLSSKPIDQAVFTLEPNKLSQIIEDERGYHIVRVVERTEAGQVPFLETQQKIKDAITLARREAEYKKFVESLRTKTAVWTIYDDEAALARQPMGTQLR